MLVYSSVGVPRHCILPAEGSQVAPQDNLNNSGKERERGSPLVNALLTTSVPKVYMLPIDTFNSHY